MVVVAVADVDDDEDDDDDVVVVVVVVGYLCPVFIPPYASKPSTLPSDLFSSYFKHATLSKACLHLDRYYSKRERRPLGNENSNYREITSAKFNKRWPRLICYHWFAMTANYYAT